jgi:hypothetical protein
MSSILQKSSTPNENLDILSSNQKPWRRASFPAKGEESSPIDGDVGDFHQLASATI